MSVHSDIEAGLLKAIQANGDLAFKVIEADIRDCLFSGDKLVSGFRPEELPALNFSATIDPTPSRPFTTGEVLYEIPVSFCVVTKAQGRKDAFDQAKGLQEALERFLNALRKTNDVLGANRFVAGDVTSSAITVQSSPYCFAVGTTAAKITVIQEI